MTTIYNYHPVRKNFLGRGVAHKRADGTLDMPKFSTLEVPPNTTARFNEDTGKWEPVGPTITTVTADQISTRAEPTPEPTPEPALEGVTIVNKPKPRKRRSRKK